MCIVRLKRVYPKIPNIGERRYRKVLQRQYGTRGIHEIHANKDPCCVPSTFLYLHSPIFGILG